MSNGLRNGKRLIGPPLLPLRLVLRLHDTKAVKITLVKDVPYVNSGKEIKRGILIIKLVLANDETGKPDTHVAYFSGDYPCNEDGAEIDKINAGGAQSFAEGVAIHHTFSAKPKPNDAYPNYYDQVRTYVAVISGPAQRIDEAFTAKTFPVNAPDEDSDEPFNHIDTASSRAQIVEAMKNLKLRKMVILGLGGTGSYVLDLVAKAPVREIHLYDGDTFYQHKAFRSRDRAEPIYTCLLRPLLFCRRS